MNETSSGDIYESWKEVEDEELSGKSFSVNDGDTLVFESIQLFVEDGGIFYSPTVPGQNEGRTIRFTASKITEENMTFENAEHDFPQVISYQKIGSDSLVATISGVNKGHERRAVFRMRRVE